ncbi:MAG: hypothetical protein IKP86_13400 [Anaerolineaceae bacterium]|nr:hypothetical protein [Anaerolineaceae bacterium]
MADIIEFIFTINFIFLRKKVNTIGMVCIAFAIFHFKDNDKHFAMGHGRRRLQLPDTVGPERADRQLAN